MSRTIFNKKSIVFLLVGILIVTLLVIFYNQREGYFYNSNKVQLSLDKIGHKEINLNYIFLESTIFLYSNNDDLVRSISDLKDEISKLEKNEFFKKNYGSLYKKFKNDYAVNIDKKIEMIYEFNSINSTIKNSNTFLLYSISKFPKEHMSGENKFPVEYIHSLISTISNIFLSKNSLKNFIEKENIDKLENFKFHDKGQEKINKNIVAHLKMIYEKFPIYKDLLKKITHEHTLVTLAEINNNFFNKNLKTLKNVNYVFVLIIGLVIFYTLFVIFLFSRIDRENLKLKRVSDKLKKSIKTDILTGLYNRYKYEKDIEKSSGKDVLYLVNINKFKQINEYYGTKIGDLTLKKVGEILKKQTTSYGANIYRLGADDFGILISSEKNRDLIYSNLSRKIVEWFENNEIEVENLKFKVSVCIGISDSSPYFEKADIALRVAKDSHRLKCMQYSEEYNRAKEIENNINKSKILYDAIKYNRVIPFYQPIVNIETKEIEKYEVLARVLHEDGRVETIFPYLQIAKDNKMYYSITMAILKKSIKEFSAYKNLNFSINFSIEDILDEKIIAYLEEISIKNSYIFDKITFELLESEAIDDYNEIKLFIEFVKARGAKVAIDDFGSGYSNFEHLLNLDIDFLKIDGSLIKHIDTDESSKRIVSLISQFAKESGIEVVAEFVENEKICQILKELDVKYAQGYYFFKPSQKIF